MYVFRDRIYPLSLILLAAIGVIVPIVIRPTLQNMVVIFGAIGLAVGFAFKDYLSNVIGGVAAIIERAYRPGDWVRIGDAYGEVRSVGLRSVSLVTRDDSVVFIPNARSAGSASKRRHGGGGSLDATPPCVKAGAGSNGCAASVPRPLPVGDAVGPHRRGVPLV
jgi:small-conductance mechanosensitive channel